MEKNNISIKAVNKNVRSSPRKLALVLKEIKRLQKLFVLEIKSLKKFISPLPLLEIQIVKKSSSEPELNVISFEIIYSGIHLSECIIHFSSETFFETLTSNGLSFFGFPIKNF